MEFVRINSKDNNYFDDVMNIYKVSFPIFEQRTIKNQIDVLKDDKYNCMAVCENNEFNVFLKERIMKYSENIVLLKPH